MTPAEETRCIKALLRLTATLPLDERAAWLPGMERRAREQDEDPEALRIAHDHGIDAGRIAAYDSLARSRNLPLSAVLRSALRGELRSVVVMPPRVRQADSTPPPAA